MEDVGVMREVVVTGGIERDGMDEQMWMGM